MVADRHSYDARCAYKDEVALRLSGWADATRAGDLLNEASDAEREAQVQRVLQKLPSPPSKHTVSQWPPAGADYVCLPAQVIRPCRESKTGWTQAPGNRSR